MIGLLFLLSVLLAIYIGTRSDEWWRDQVTNTLSESLGREVEIQGAFHLDLGRRLKIEMASVRISNPAWAESKDFLQLGSLLLEFDLFSVLSDTVFIHRLILADVVLALEEHKDGEQNWDFAPNTSLPATTLPIDDKQTKEIIHPAHIEQLSLERAQLTLIQPRWNSPLVLKVDAITGGQSADDKAILHSRGELGNLPFSIEGSVGTITSALNNGPVSYQLNGNIGKARLKSEGHIDSLAAPLRPKLELVFSGPDIKKITQAMGAPTIAKGPFEARVNTGPGGLGVSTQVRAKFGAIQFHADVSSEDLSSTKKMELTAGLSGENLAAFSDLLGLPPLPKGAFKLETAMQSDEHGARIKKLMASVDSHHMSIEGKIGSWPELKETQLALTMKGPNLAAFNPTVKTISLGELPPVAYTAAASVESNKQGLRVHSTKIVAGDYQATADGNIYTQDRFRTELNVTGAGPDLSMISRLTDIIPLPAWPFHAHGKIEITHDAIKLINTVGNTGITKKEDTSDQHNVSVDGSIAFSREGPVLLNVKGHGPSLHAVLDGLGYPDIPAKAAYQVEGQVGFSRNRLTVKLPHARLEPATASGIFSIPNINTPTTMILDVDHMQTSDISAALKLVGVKLNLPRAMAANFNGKINRIDGVTKLSNIRAIIGSTNALVDGSIGDPPRYEHSRLNLDISGPNLEHFFKRPVKLAIPFHIKGGVSLEKDLKHFHNLKLKLANLDATVDGQLNSLEKTQNSELNISASAPNLDAIAAIFEVSLPAGSAKLESHITGMKDGIHIDRLHAEFDKSNLTANLKWVRGETPLLVGQVNSSYIDYTPFQKKTDPIKQNQEKPVNLQDNNKRDRKINEDDENDYIQKPQKWLFPDKPIEIPIFERMGVDLDLDVQIDKLDNLLARGLLRSIKTKVDLKGRTLHLSNFQMHSASGANVQGELNIVQDAEHTRLDIDITGEQLRIGLAAAPTQTPETYSPSNVEIKISATGSTYRKLASSLQGRIKLIQGEGQISNQRVVNLLSNTFYELFQTLNPFSRTEATTRLNCGVGIINVANGIADIQAAVMQTDKLTIVSAGKINLKTERLNLGFNTRPRRGLGISVSAITNSYIKLGGHLTRPIITLDPEGATLATGAAVATGGLSFLFKGFWDRFLTSRDPCGEALKIDAEIQNEKRKNSTQP